MPKANVPQLDPIRKVAILVATLDHRVADELLERMSDEQAALVRDAVVEIDEIPEAERELVMQDFLGTGTRDDQVDDSAVELDAELARKLAASEHLVGRPPVEREEPLFRFLCDAEMEAIATHLRHENPQITALVIAHLPPRQAAELLKHFEPRLQANLLRRIAELGTADRDIVCEVEKHLKMLLHDDLRAAKNRAIGLSTVASILTAAGETRGQFISSLTRHERQLAQQLHTPKRHATHAAPQHDQDRLVAATASRHPVKPPSAGDRSSNREPGRPKQRIRARAKEAVDPSAHVPVPLPTTYGQAEKGVTFEELSRLRDSDLAIVFRESGSKFALLALTGATPEFVDRLLRQLPAREAHALRRRIEQLGPLRLSDIEQAQRSIAEIADQLIAAGAIDSPQKNLAATA